MNSEHPAQQMILVSNTLSMFGEQKVCFFQLNRINEGAYECIVHAFYHRKMCRLHAFYHQIFLLPLPSCFYSLFFPIFDIECRLFRYKYVILHSSLFDRAQIQALADGGTKIRKNQKFALCWCILYGTHIVEVSNNNCKPSLIHPCDYCLAKAMPSQANRKNAKQNRVIHPFLWHHAHIRTFTNTTIYACI